MRRYFAHSVQEQPVERWQPLSVHLLNVCELAGTCGKEFGAEKAAQAAGLLHDLGKYTELFLLRLHGGAAMDHSTAGAREILALANPREVHFAEVVAHAIAGHHVGMPDRRGDGGAHLDGRLAKELPELAKIWREEIGSRLPSSLVPTEFAWHGDPKRRPFQLSMLGRFIFSCLVDADFRDTEAFYAEADGRSIDRDFDAPLPKLRDRLDAHFDVIRNDRGDINRLRGRVLDHVRGEAILPPGLFSLTAPTGGGKTLASLAFALDHAVTHRLDRVIYAIPFTSVIDQTARIFRDVLGEETVLEHHSAIETDLPLEEGRVSGAAKLRLAMEDWSAPVVATTNVQLFESLFSNRPSRCRKLHNLARSVIVLDEAQTIPRRVLTPCIAAIDELARNYGASVVLCTATQPALNAPDFKGGLENVRELAPDPPGLQRRFARVTFRRAGEMGDDELVAALAATESGLVIVNSRRHALELYRAAKAEGLDGLLHLTTRMVAAPAAPPPAKPATLGNMIDAPSFWYVASPYSKFPGGIEAAFVAVARFTARLVEHGVPVFSPIAHSHPLAMHGGLDPLDHEIWIPADEPMMKAASGLIVCTLPTWRDSYGVGVEISEFTRAGKPVVYMSPEMV